MRFRSASCIFSCCTWIFRQRPPTGTASPSESAPAAGSHHPVRVKQPRPGDSRTPCPACRFLSALASIAMSCAAKRLYRRVVHQGSGQGMPGCGQVGHSPTTRLDAVLRIMAELQQLLRVLERPACPSPRWTSSLAGNSLPCGHALNAWGAPAHVRFALFQVKAPRLGRAGLREPEPGALMVWRVAVLYRLVQHAMDTRPLQRACSNAPTPARLFQHHPRHGRSVPPPALPRRYRQAFLAGTALTVPSSGMAPSSGMTFFVTWMHSF